MLILNLFTFLQFIATTRLFYEKKLGKLIDSGGNPTTQQETEESEGTSICAELFDGRLNIRIKFKIKELVVCFTICDAV